MSREQWERLTRRQQLRILHAMREATARAAFNLETIHVERMLEGMWEAFATTRAARSEGTTDGR